ncbi:MAG: leucine-rich repeat domain-containing protein [Leptospiraceae bacterium]|nr:leucine-rich repeat domain-containing protein [Leptospiraceae bacterium]
MPKNTNLFFSSRLPFVLIKRIFFKKLFFSNLFSVLISFLFFHFCATGPIPESDYRKIENYSATGLQSALKNPANTYVLQLNNYQLTNIPEQIYNFKNLQELYLKDNNISVLPTKIGEIKNLTVLSTENNQLTSLPRELGKLKYLEKLILNNNKIETLPKEISELTQLKVLEIGKNKLKILPDLKELQKLTILNVSENEFTLFPESILALKSLEILNIVGKKLDIPEKLSILTSLKEISLGSPASIHPSIFSLKNLKRIEYKKNNFPKHSVTANMALLRSTPSLSGKAVETLPQSTEIVVLFRTGKKDTLDGKEIEWVFIEKDTYYSETKKGFVPDSFLSEEKKQ